MSAAAVGYEKLGPGDRSATAPGGPPATGPTIVYDISGASDANGVGSSVVRLPLSTCPDGMGYAPVAARQLRAQRFDASLVNHGMGRTPPSPPTTAGRAL